MVWLLKRKKSENNRLIEGKSSFQKGQWRFERKLNESKSFVQQNKLKSHWKSMGKKLNARKQMATIDIYIP